MWGRYGNKPRWLLNTEGSAICKYKTKEMNTEGPAWLLAETRATQEEGPGLLWCFSSFSYSHWLKSKVASYSPSLLLVSLLFLILPHRFHQRKYLKHDRRGIGNKKREKSKEDVQLQNSTFKICEHFSQWPDTLPTVSKPTQIFSRTELIEKTRRSN